MYPTAYPGSTGPTRAATRAELLPGDRAQGDPVRRTDFLRSRLLTLALLATIAAPPLVAQEPVPYRFDPEALVLEGCFPPCRCLIRGDALGGEFLLVEVDPGPDAGPDEERYELRDIVGFVGEGGSAIGVLGRGVYVRSPGDRTHELRLELTIGDREPEVFSSGRVAGGGEFPRLQIEVAVGQRECFDHAIDVFATPGASPRFIRGDCNADGGRNVADAVFALRSLFDGGRLPACEAACDTDADEILTVTDAVALLGFLFQGAIAPPAPGPACGSVAPGRLPCADDVGCAI